MPPAATSPQAEHEPLLSHGAGDSTYGSSSPDGNGVHSPRSAHGGDPEANVEVPPEDPEAQRARQNVKMILPALAVGMFLAAMDASVVNANYVRIATDFQSLEQASWISTAYFLAMSSCQPLYGKMSDIFGRKPCVLVAYSVFAVSSLACGLAQNMGQFIAARVVQGCGGAGVAILVTVLISDVIPLRERGPWQGYLNLIYAAGLGVGAPIGGLFADTIGWRWTFLAQVPLILLAILSVVILLRLPEKDHSEWRSRLRRVDFPGALLLVATVTFLLFGLDHGSNVSWTHVMTIVPLSAVPVLLVCLILVEAKYAQEPFTPAHIIFNRTLLSVYLTNFFMYGGWFALIFYIPLFYQAVDSVTSSQAGVRLLPAILLGVSGTLVGGFILKRTGRYYWLMVMSSLGASVAMILVVLGTVYVAYDTAIISVGLLLNSGLYGVAVCGSLIALISNVTPDDQAIATACMFLFRSLGCAMGISFSGTILQKALQTNLERALQSGPSTDEIVNGVRESLAYIKQLTPDVQRIVRAEYGASVRMAFVFQMILFFVSFLASCWIREKRMDR